MSSLIQLQTDASNFALDRPEGFFGAETLSFWIIIVGIVGVTVAIVFFATSVFNILRETRQNYLLKKMAKPIGKRKASQIFFAAIDEIEELLKAGRLTDDEAYYEVSQALKVYASAKTGDNLRSTTRRDFEDASGLATFWETIDALYLPEFSDRTNDPEPLAPLDATELAKNLVRRW